MVVVLVLTIVGGSLVGGSGDGAVSVATDASSSAAAVEGRATVSAVPLATTAPTAATSTTERPDGQVGGQPGRADLPTTEATPSSTTSSTTETTATPTTSAPTTTAHTHPTTTQPPRTTTTHAHPPSTTTTTAPPTTTTTAPEPEPQPEADADGESGGEYAYDDPRNTQTWYDLADCESGGNWSINTGNGYYGGLQFSQYSWESVGGTGYPHEHPAETQIEMGRRLQARQGWGAWPHCSEKLGLR